MKTLARLVILASLVGAAACSTEDDAGGSDATTGGDIAIQPGGDANGNGGGGDSTGGGAGQDATDAGPTGDTTAGVDTGGAGDTGGAIDAGLQDTGEADAGGTDDAGGGTDTADAGGDSDTGGPGTGFESSELLIRIVGPSSQDWAQSATPYLNVNGVLFGHADTITWIHEETGNTGEVPVGAFWYVGGIKLEEGSNTISVIATAGDEVATDQIHVAHNPTFAFDGPPVVSPSVLFVGESTQTIATIRISTYKNFDPTTVKLHLVDAAGDVIETKGDMKDNGNTSGNCDEVDKDGLFSSCLSLKQDAEGCVFVRASVQATFGFQKYEAWSPVTKVCAVPRITAAACEEVVQTQQDAKSQYATLLEGATPAEAQAALIESLLLDESIAEAGPAEDGYGVWIRYSNGLLGALDLSPDGLRAGGYSTIDAAATTTNNDVGSKDVTVLAPFKAEFGDLDEATEIATILKNVGCPYFGVSAYQNDQASLYRFRHMSGSGIVALSSHGDAYFGGLSDAARQKLGWDHDGAQEVVWTGEKVDCTKLMQAPKTCSGAGLECENGAGECVLGKSSQCVDFKQHDLRLGRVIFGDQTYGIVPDFVAHHAAHQPFDRGIVYLGACRTMWNGGFAAALFGAGAQTVLGYSDYVTSQFAHDEGVEFFTNLITNKMTAGESFGEGATDAEAGGSFRMFGSSKAAARDGSIVNPSFETGDLTGWKTDGDGRVISQLGFTVPVDGKFMALVSSGLGFTQEIGEIKQKFCIEAGKSTVTFYWKYFSEEFLEWCGSGYQDPFEASIENDVGKIILASLSVNALCPPNQCGGCGSKYVGLEPSDVNFDQGDVYNTQWQLAETNISALTAITGPVTLKFFLTDAGDTIYDTVVLIDKIDFK